MTISRISAYDAIAAVHSARRDSDVVITTMATSRDWMTMTQHPLDIVFIPSAMGHATSIGLGLALARPERTIVVCNGDGSMLMNLGSLVSITAAGVKNLIVIVFDNGTYEVTGAQPTPGSPEGRADGNRVSFGRIARGCGFERVFHFTALEPWKAALPQLLSEPGPTLVVLDVETVQGRPGPKSPGPAGERAKKFIQALGA